MLGQRVDLIDTLMSDPMTLALLSVESQPDWQKRTMACCSEDFNQPS
jgi:hypothetical protein